jgi:hypothetical protein
MFAKDEHPFRWAPGIIGVEWMSEQRFNELIDKVAVA